MKNWFLIPTVLLGAVSFVCIISHSLLTQGLVESLPYLGAFSFTVALFLFLLGIVFKIESDQ